MKAHTNWKPYLENEFKKEYFINLTHFLKEELQSKTIYPPKEDWYNALSLAPENVKVVIIGQDPYHGPNQAHGLSFSVKPGVKLPPSLQNIYKEIEKEFDYSMSNSGDLNAWLNQGVLLLNSVLTVQASNAGSHQKRGWETFTDEIIKILSNEYEHIVFMLWGNFAISKSSLINQNKHLILTSPHPSPFSVHKGFFGNNHFKKANEYLEKNGKKPIDWKN